MPVAAEPGAAPLTVEEHNTALILDGYRRWSESGGASVEHWLDMAADDISLQLLGDIGGPAPARGKAALRAYLGAVNDHWRMLAYDVTETIAQGERVVAIIDSAWLNRHTGQTGRLRMVNIWRIRDGRAVEFTEFYDTALAMAAAQGPPR